MYSSLYFSVEVISFCQLKSKCFSGGYAESRSWSKVIPENRGPSARFSVAGDCLDERKGIIVFLGGCNKSLEALDDMYYLHTG